MNEPQASTISDEVFPQLNFKDMANAIRALSMDAVEKANSGHPGMPMGMADVATILFSKFLKFSPNNPTWPDRDRFVLSGGHGSMLLYSLLYLTGYKKMTIEAIKDFRQLESLTPGHPELMQDCGIETTTGPLGQGLANGAGFALAERILNARFEDGLVDHYTYVMCGDGDLMEGISHESCALAGHLKLSRLIVLYDDNGICIDGPTSMSYSDDVRKRFEAYGWDVQEIDGHDTAQIETALENAKSTNTPSIICCKTHIGYGAPTKQDTASAHGSPLGAEEIKGARKNLEWPHKPFHVPEDIMEQWSYVGSRSSKTYKNWREHYDNSADMLNFAQSQEGNIRKNISLLIKELKTGFANEHLTAATRKTSEMVLEKLVPAVPEMVGGSADLTGSNLTKVSGMSVITANHYNGSYIYYGVREHGMAAIMNGMALHGGIIPYGGTFMSFTDYCRPAIRLAALMKIRSIFVMTHDSIGLGEDGPTHQPVEHLAALRAMPNLWVLRPCDGVETAECWELALNRTEGPSILSLTRQGVKTLREDSDDNLCARGAYILADCGCDEGPQVTLFASGSEVEIAMEAKETLDKDDIRTRVISVPCMDIFFEQDSEYQQSFVCNDSIKIAVEAGVKQGWERFIGPHGYFIGMDSFGESAPSADLYNHFNITVEAIVEAAKNKLG